MYEEVKNSLVFPLEEKFNDVVKRWELKILMIKCQIG